jgi:hypothetical protein
VFRKNEAAPEPAKIELGPPKSAPPQARIQEKPLPTQASKVSKPPFDTLDTYPGRAVSENEPAQPPRFSDLYETEGDYARSLIRYAKQSWLTLAVKMAALHRRGPQERRGFDRRAAGARIRGYRPPEGGSRRGLQGPGAPSPPRVPTPIPFSRLQCQWLSAVSVEAWRLALDCAGRFLDEQACMAESFGWTPGDLFDVPRDGRSGLSGGRWLASGLRRLGATSFHGLADSACTLVGTPVWADWLAVVASTTTV